MNTVIAETGVVCPDCGINLVRIPKPIADDIVVCPDCGAGGQFKQVVKEGRNLLRPYIVLAQLQQLLRKAGYPGK